MNNCRLDVNKNVELLEAITRSPAITTLETLWINGNSWLDQTSWIALSKLIEAATNLTKLHVKDQGQGGNAVKFELQPAGVRTAGTANDGNDAAASNEGVLIVTNQSNGQELHRETNMRTRQIKIVH